MKKVFQFWILFLICFSATAQNWQPIHSGWKYNYKFDADSIVSATIWADSTKVISGDSVFYLNRIVSHCDTCHAALGGFNPCDSCYELINQPQFLQRKMTQLASGVFYFNDTSKLILPSHIALNDSFVFDSLAPVTAQLISTSQESVFGNLDSVKTFLLSSGDTLKLSMHNGLLLFPNQYSQNSYYRLVGIEGPNLGEQVPDFWDFFDFNVGDVFHYHGALFYPMGQGAWDRQISIINKTIFNDSVSYGIQGFYSGIGTPGGQVNNLINTTVTYVNSTINPTNYYSNQLFDIDEWQGASSSPGNRLDKVYFLIDSNGVFEKRFGYPSISNNSSNFSRLDSIEDVTNIFAHNAAIGASGEVTESFKVGLGKVGELSSGFEHYGEESLVGYLKNGITFGSILTSIPAINEKDYFSIFPNPAKDKIKINFSVFTAGKIWLSDVTGRKIMEAEFSGTAKELDISGISEGVYIVSVQGKEGIANRKVCVLK